MLKTFLTLALFTVIPVRADVLLIGDSHLEGPFGDVLHKKLASAHPEKIILLYAHASSAPLHWMSKTPYKLRGGLNHHMSYGKTYLPHPNLPNWRLPQNSLNLIKVLDNPVLHPEWKIKIPQEPEIDTVVFALGANDRDAIATSRGLKTKVEYDKRVLILEEMMKEVEDRGLKCIWIGPPSTPSSGPKNKLTYDYLADGIKKRCPIMDSTKYVAKYCDLVHFSCPKGEPKAREWGEEAAGFVENHL